MKIMFAGIIALLIIGTGAYPQEMTEIQEVIMEFSSFAADKQLDVNEWTITMKEKTTPEEAERIKADMTMLFEQPIIQKEIMTNATKYTITDSQKNKNFVETYILIYPTNKKSSTEMVYTVQGQGKPSLSKHDTKIVNKVKSRFFSKNVTIFSCLKATYSGIMNDVLVYEKFEQAFNITTINEIDDENGWTSRSGYTNQWGHTLPVGDQTVNVQFATRTLGGETTITIGTPIITAEY